MGRDVKYPITQDMEANLHKLLLAVNKLGAAYWPNLEVSSGYRPPEINASVAGAAKKSKHQVCLAVDFKDPDGTVDKFCMDNLELLEEAGLWLESPDHTPGWCHVQCVPPKSGKRVFIP